MPTISIIASGASSRDGAEVGGGGETERARDNSRGRSNFKVRTGLKRRGGHRRRRETTEIRNETDDGSSQREIASLPSEAMLLARTREKIAQRKNDVLAMVSITGE